MDKYLSRNQLLREPKYNYQIDHNSKFPLRLRQTSIYSTDQLKEEVLILKNLGIKHNVS